MRVEGGGLEHFRERKIHLVGKRRKVRGGDLFVGVLDEMQVLDQEVAAPWPVCEKQFDLVRRGRIHLAPLGGRDGPLPSFAWMLERTDLLHIMTHWERLVLSFSGMTLIIGMPDAKSKCAA